MPKTILPQSISTKQALRQPALPQPDELLRLSQAVTHLAAYAQKVSELARSLAEAQAQDQQHSSQERNR